MEKNTIVPELLHPGHLAESSPTSSVFDLPTQNHPAPGGRRKPAPLRVSKGSDASYIVISGGTGCNSICSAFGQNACYVLPVSDDGGSSSEIIRVIGGPSIGDIRSRLIRLIPPTPASSSLIPLLSHRLPCAVSEREARDEWRSIVEGKSPLWHGIPADRKEAIRGFLVYFESEVLKRAHKNFSFRNGSVGNYLLAAAQGFFRSLPSAIFFFSSITNSQADILPVLVTNHTVTIAAELDDNTTVIGQCNISHPVRPRALSGTPPTSPDVDAFEDSRLPRKTRNLSFAKPQESGDEYHVLPARISRLFYINAYGHEIHPSPNPEFLSKLGERDVLAYSCGSLWTSIMPCLALRGVASAIARSKSLKAKVLLLNSTNDRETHGFTAVDYVRAIATTLRTTDALPGRPAPSMASPAQDYPTSAFITHVVYLRGCAVHVDVGEIHAVGVECVEVESQEVREGGSDGLSFDTPSVQEALRKILRGINKEEFE